MKFKPYPKYKPSGVEWLGEIPEHWEIRRLKHVANYRVSNVDKVPQGDELPVRLCNYTDVYYNENITRDMEFMESTATKEEIDKFKLSHGDVVITKDSEEWDDIAIPALIKEDIPNLLCGYHLAIIRPFSNVLLGEHLFRLLQASSINQQFQISSTGVTRYGLPKSSIGEALVPLPPISEQKNIARMLSRELTRIDELVHKKKKLIERLKEKRGALISHTVTKGLPPQAARAAGLPVNPKMKPSGVEWLGDVPEHWEIKRIRDCISRNDGGVWGEEPLNDGTDTVVLRSTEQTVDGFWDIVDPAPRSLSKMEKDRALLKEGDLIVTKSSGSELHIGKTSIVTKDVEKQGCCYSNFMQRLRGSRNTFPKYLWYIFNNIIAREQFVYYSNSTTGLANLNPSLIGQVSVAYPPFHEQEIIAEYLDGATGKINGLVDKISQVIERLNEYRTGLISAAVAGHINVSEVHYAQQI